jgi:CheY-like chemotaxis protein
MKREIHILSVEDVPADTEMINHELRRAGMAFRTRRVASRQAFLHELEHHPPDVILSDHGLPTFDGFTALALAREKCPNVPFIFVTGSLGEEKVIEIFENGAAHCVLKNRLTKLPPVVQKALQEAEERRSQNPAATAPIKLLPICAHCKKIRDDTNHWQPLELYFLKHFNLQFSHGLCPGCVPDYFPEPATSQ